MDREPIIQTHRYVEKVSAAAVRLPSVVRGDAEAVRDARKTARNSSKVVSRCALNATNFFLAQVVTLVVPFLVDFLRINRWPSHAIGVAAGMSGLGILCSMIPAGIWLDHVRRRRHVLAMAAVGVGTLLGAVPLVPTKPIFINILMFVAGTLESFFTPLLMALALSMAGARGFNRLLGANQAWDHAGSIVSALFAMALVRWTGPRGVFFCLTGASLLVAAACFMIRPEDLDEPRRATATNPFTMLRFVIDERAIRVLFPCAVMLHLANASILPLVVLRIQSIGATSTTVGSLVVVAQGAMLVAAYFAGSGAERWGRKPVMAVAFCILPIRILLDAWLNTVSALLYVQVLDGLTIGIFAVVVGSICVDVAGTKGSFTTSIGITASAQAFGGLVGPLTAGYLLERLDFTLTFYCYAALAALSAALFTWRMPETKPVS